MILIIPEVENESPALYACTSKAVWLWAYPKFLRTKASSKNQTESPSTLDLDLICECLILSHSASLTQIISIPHTVSLLDWHPVHLLNQGLVESLSYSRYLINIYSMTQINECYMAKPNYVEEGGAVEGKCYPNSVCYSLKLKLISILCEVLP